MLIYSGSLRINPLLKKNLNPSEIKPINWSPFEAIYFRQAVVMSQVLQITESIMMQGSFYC